MRFLNTTNSTNENKESSLPKAEKLSDKLSRLFPCTTKPYDRIDDLEELQSAQARNRIGM